MYCDNVNISGNEDYANNLLYGLSINIASHLERIYDDEDTLIIDKIPNSEMGTIDKTFHDDPYDDITFYYGTRPSYEGSTGIQKTIRQVRTHYEPAYSINYLKGLSQANTVEYAVKVEASNINEDGEYTLHFGDDKLIALRDDENDFDILHDYRLLKHNEYRLSRVTMPEYQPEIDISGKKASYNYKIHLYQYDSGTKEYTEIRTSLEGDTSTEQTFNVYDLNVHKVEVEITTTYGLEYTAYFGYTFDLDVESADAIRSGQTKIVKRNADTNELLTDPYGRLVNYSYMYTEYKDNNGDTVYNGTDYNTIYGYKTYGYDKNELNSYMGLYDHYKGTDESYLSYNIQYDNNGNEFSDYNGLLEDLIPDSNGVYKKRSAEAFRIKDPEISTWTTTDYTRDQNNALINLEIYNKEGKRLGNDDAKVAGTYYTELTSKTLFKADDTADLNKIVIKTLLPKELAAENNDNSKYTANSIGNKVSSVEGFSLQTTSGTLPVSTIQELEAYCSSTKKGEYVDIVGTDYCYFVEELVFAEGVSLQLPKDVEASISITYPLLMSFNREATWKQTQGTAQFYGYTTVDAETSAANLKVVGASESNTIKAQVIDPATNKDVKTDIQDDDASSQTTSKLPASAASWLENTIKTVTSDVYGSLDNDGKYAVVNPYEEISGNQENQPRYAYYSYKLMYSMGNEYARRLYIYDNLEDAHRMNGLNSNIKESEWRGTLQSVTVEGDLNKTNFEVDNNHNGIIMKATVYYNKNPFSDELYTTKFAGDGVETSYLPEGEGWYTEEDFKAEYNVNDLESAKAICVVVRAENSDGTEALIARGQDVYFSVNMKAPVKQTGANEGKIDDGLGNENSVKDSSLVLDTETYNNFTVRYARLDSNGKRESYFMQEHANEPANSDYTTVTLKDTLLKVNLVKTDGNRKLPADTATKYMPITGAEFLLYEKSTAAAYNNSQIPETQNETATLEFIKDEENYKEVKITYKDKENKITGYNYWIIDGTNYYRAIQNKASSYKENGQVKYNYEYVTDISGELVLSLSPTDYILVETKMPDGYSSIGDIYFTVSRKKDNEGNDIINLDGSVDFEIPEITKILKDGEQVDISGDNLETMLLFGDIEKSNGNSSCSMEVTNKEKPGQVTLVKYDTAYKTVFGEYQQTVAGAVYQLYTSVGDPVYFEQSKVTETTGEGENTVSVAFRCYGSRHSERRDYKVCNWLRNTTGGRYWRYNKGFSY